MTGPNNGGAAFPEHRFTHYGNGAGRQTMEGGMSLRDWFAGQELGKMSGMNPNLPGDPASTTEWPGPEELARRRAKWAYLQADAMLAARTEGGAHG